VNIMVSPFIMPAVSRWDLNRRLNAKELYLLNKILLKQAEIFSAWF